MDERLVKVLKICAFIAVVNLPFITVAQLIGINTFLDSFETPESYQYIKSGKIDMHCMNEDYIIFKKSFNPDCSIMEGDKILCLKDGERLSCHKVYHISREETLKKYYTINFSGDINDEPIYEHQIIGKVVSIVHNNVWNIISLKVWNASIHNLNLAALFTNN